MRTGLSNTTPEILATHVAVLRERHGQQRNNPNLQQEPIVLPPKGPGDYLHDAILKWVGEGPTRKCGCEDKIRHMNAWGPEGCCEHIEEITDWLMEEAAKRGWWKVATIIPCSRFAVKQLLILPAIRRAEPATTHSSDS